MKMLSLENAGGQEQVASGEVERHDGRRFGRVAGEAQRLDDGAALEHVRIVRDVDVLERRLLGEPDKVPQLDGAVERRRGKDRSVAAEGHARDSHRVAGQLGQQVAVSQIPHEDLLVRPARSQETAVDREAQRRDRTLSF